MFSGMSSNACIWDELVDLTFLWPANKVARAVTTWARACDKRLQYCVMWVIQLNIADWFHFKTLILLETLKIQNQHQVKSHVTLGVGELSNVDRARCRSQFEAQFYIFEEKGRCAQNDSQRQVSNNETCVKNPQSFS